MRPALLRLLKRPSAVSILDSLTSVPIGVEQLESRPTCLRCHTRRLQKAATNGESEPSSGKLRTNRCQAPEKRAFRFPVYDIDAPDDLTPSRKELALDAAVDRPSASLSLQPDRLEFESDIGHTNEIGTRLVDDPGRRHDYSLWEELLRYRQRHYGDDGTLDIFRGLTRRVDGVYLPTHGESADFFWQSFVNLGLEREHFLQQLAEYALTVYEEEGRCWGRFHESVVGGFFERDMVHNAIKWHRRLQYPHLARPNDILRILEPALSVRTGRLSVLAKGKLRPLSPGVQAFQDICQTVDGHDLYRPIISTLLQHGYAEDALSMHAFLVNRRHPPPSYQDMYPLLEYANNYGLWNDFLNLKNYAERRFPADTESAGQTKAALVEQGSNINAGDLLMGKRSDKRPMKDEFGAKLFATPAFSLDTVLSGLEIFGVPEIGPLSLREMAIRSHGTRDIQEKLQRLQKARISIGDSVYTRLLRKLATENRDILLGDLLESDQHPDMLEDAAIQESLLVSNYMARDWRQYNLALAALGELLKPGAELPNIHFRKHIASGELELASKVVDEMALVRESLTRQSMEFMVKRLLTIRRTGSNPQPTPRGTRVEPLAFVVRILQRVVPTGQYIAPDLWIELLKRLGMTKRFQELRNCCLWLAHHYSSRVKHSPVSDTGTPFPGKPQPSQPWQAALTPDGADRMLQSIFNPQMQCGIVAWGFLMLICKPEKTDYNPFGVEGERLIPWTRGLVLLRDLEKEGVRLDVPCIRLACRRRLAIIFGQPRKSIKRMNNTLRRENPYELQQVLTDIDRAWGRPMFPGSKYNDLDRLVDPPNVTLKKRTGIQRRKLEEQKEWRTRM